MKKRKCIHFLDWIITKKATKVLIWWNFFLKTGQKKMPWTSYFTIWFWLFGACHMWNYCFFYFPIDSQPPLTIFSHLLFFLKIQHIIFLRQVFLNESKKMPWTSYMVFGTSPLIPSLGWPYLDICSFFEIFRPSSSWVQEDDGLKTAVFFEKRANV